MKYGQTFQALLNENPAFAKWESSVVQYKTLKKIINRVAQELESAGLDADHLKPLLEQEQWPQQISNPDHHLKSRRDSAQSTLQVRAEYEISGTLEAPEPSIKLVFSGSDQIQHCLANTTDAELLDLIRMDTGGFEERLHVALDQGHEAESFPLPDEKRHQDWIKSATLDGAHFSAAEMSTPLLSRLYGDDLVPASALSPPGTPIWDDKGQPGAEPESIEDALGDLPAFTLPEPSLDALSFDQSISRQPDQPASSSRPQCHAMESRLSNSHIASQRTITIPLPNDSHFFSILAGTLVSLEALESMQKMRFRKQIETLAASVRQVAAPRSKSDLYRWRDIFGLWIEASIFEGHTEQERRQPRSAEESKQRLLWFTDQVGRRHLAQSMRFKASSSVLNAFVELNQALVQLHEFVEANQMAVRKILKKHDKRTALSGSHAFADLGLEISTSFQRLGSSAPAAATLPRVISSTFTETLLPIVPQLDDVNCPICSEVAWRPIRLRSCGHKLCLKCLVQLQKLRKDSCPLCRCPGLLEATIIDIDLTLQAYVQQYFPKESRLMANEQDQEATQVMLGNLVHRPGSVGAGGCTIL